MTLSDVAKRMMEDLYGEAPFAVGDVVKHSKGHMVKIIGGQYWGTFGLSNFWYWRKVNDDETLGKKECGYGWRPDKED